MLCVVHKRRGMISTDNQRTVREWSRSGLSKSLMWLLVACIVMACSSTAEESAFAGVEIKSVSACEDDYLVLECQAGEVIRILRANYGRFTISVCNRHGQTDGWNLQCMLPKAKDIVSERCDGRQACDMRVSSHVFGDPCPLTFKYAEVKYMCHLVDVPRTLATTTTTVRPPMPLNGSPKPPHITSVTVLSPTSIEIVWTHPEPFNPYLKTAVYVKDIARKMDLPHVYAKLQTYLIVNELRPSTLYSISLKSFNNHGPSVTSNIVNVTTPAQDENYSRSTTSTMNSANTSLVPVSEEQHLYTTEKLPISINVENTTLSATATHQTSTHYPRFTSSQGGLSTDLYPGVSSDEENKLEENVNGVVDKFCDERIHRGVVWPATSFGRSGEKNCPDGLNGTATWHCLGYGWDKSGPDLSDCTSQWMEKIDAYISGVPADQASEALNEAFLGQELTAGDLKKASQKLLPKLIKGLQREDSTTPTSNKLSRMIQFKKAFISATSSLLSKKNFYSWRNLTQQDRRRAATSIILAVENTGFQASSFINVGNSEVTVEENIIMEVKVMDTQQTHSDITFPYKKDLGNTPWEPDSDTGSITLKSTSLKILGMKGPINMVFTMYKNMEDLMQPQLNTFSATPTFTASNNGESSHSVRADKDNRSLELPEAGTFRIVNTRIIAASISSTMPKRKLIEPVVFTLQHLKLTREGKPLCSYWDIENSYLSGHWSQNGCKLLDTNITHTTCECDHLTSFAVLMDVTGIKLSQENELALRIITFIGCVISIICLILSWITFLVFKNLHCDRNTIHRNLVLCLLLAEIVFLGGINQTEPKVVCSIIAGLLHYLFLGAFAWMCLEGVQLYIMLVEVFEQEKSRVHWYYLFGYGAPALVVAISSGVYYDGYGTDRHCWLTTENHFIWSFVGPVLAIMLINIAMLSIAIYKMCHHSAMSVATRAKPKVSKFSIAESLDVIETITSPKLRFPDLPLWVKGSVVLVVLLGLTWLLGILYLNEDSVVMAYFFTVLNSLQGQFIFIFHCLKNEKVQKEYRKVARSTQWLPNCIRVNYGGYTGETSSSHIRSSSSANYLSKLFGQKGNKHMSASTNSSSKPFLGKDLEGRSDVENSTGRNSSIAPSSLNGYTYNPSYSNNLISHVRTPFLSSSNIMVKTADNWHNTEDNGYETVQEMIVNLPVYTDCSDVGSEFVPDYCKQNMQYNGKGPRSSTDSEYNYSEKPLTHHYYVHGDSQPVQSTASRNKKPLSCSYNSKMHNRSITDDPDKDNDERLRPKPPDHSLNLHQYVIPAARQNNNQDKQNLSDQQSQRADNACTGVTKMYTGASIDLRYPKAENFPQHSPTNNLQFHQSFTKPLLESSITNTVDGVYLSQDITEPVYEDVKTYTDTASSRSSLSNPELNESSFDPYLDPVSVNHGHPSHITFNTFKFT